MATHPAALTDVVEQPVALDVQHRNGVLGSRRVLMPRSTHNLTHAEAAMRPSRC